VAWLPVEAYQQQLTFRMGLGGDHADSDTDEFGKPIDKMNRGGAMGGMRGAKFSPMGMNGV
jgi:hypothetical protein